MELARHDGDHKELMAQLGALRESTLVKYKADLDWAHSKIRELNVKLEEKRRNHHLNTALIASALMLVMELCRYIVEHWK